jgi:hypothetical protein
MIGTGNGAELRQPLGYTIVGDLFLSQLLTLYRRRLTRQRDETMATTRSKQEGSRRMKPDFCRASRRLSRVIRFGTIADSWRRSGPMRD